MAKCVLRRVEKELFCEKLHLKSAELMLTFKSHLLRHHRRSDPQTKQSLLTHFTLSTHNCAASHDTNTSQSLMLVFFFYYKIHQHEK